MAPIPHHTQTSKDAQIAFHKLTLASFQYKDLIDHELTTHISTTSWESLCTTFEYLWVEFYKSI